MTPVEVLEGIEEYMKRHAIEEVRELVGAMRL